MHIAHLYLFMCEREGRIQLPKSVRTMKKMEKTIPLSFTPPWDSMPSYITMFQSSPVRIYTRGQEVEEKRGRYLEKWVEMA